MDALEKLNDELGKELKDMEDAGKIKGEKVLSSPQGNHITIDGKNKIQFASNNYLGLANHPRLKKAHEEAGEKYGAGAGGVRFIYGTFEPHIQLEKKLSEFFGKEDTVLFSGAFASNVGLIPTIMKAKQKHVVISDELNHASIIDGLRLARTDKAIYKHNDMNELEEALKKFEDYDRKLVVTDGVFSMRGDYAPLDKIVELTQKYGALLAVDDSHGTASAGKTGRGTPEIYGAMDGVDILVSTLGKAFGAEGGFVSGSKNLVQYLKETSRFYIFSNPISPAGASVALESVNLVDSPEGVGLLKKLRDNTDYFRKTLVKNGVNIIEGDHAVVPVMVYDTKKAQQIRNELDDYGLVSVAITFPVVPRGKARLRMQVSAAHTQHDLDYAIKQITEIGKKYDILK